MGVLRTSRTVSITLTAALLLLAVSLHRVASAGVDDPPLPSVAFLARADNPVDALAASSVAGQLGGAVLLSSTATLSQETADALVALAPDVVVLAGGPAALSPSVEGEVAVLLPDAQVLRRAGDTRVSTAVALSNLPGELGFSRPVLTGATVAGDVGISGNLLVDGQDVNARLAALEAELAELRRVTERLHGGTVGEHAIGGSGGGTFTPGGYRVEIDVCVTENVDCVELATPLIQAGDSGRLIRMDATNTPGFAQAVALLTNGDGNWVNVESRFYDGDGNFAGGGGTSGSERGVFTDPVSFGPGDVDFAGLPVSDLTVVVDNVSITFDGNTTTRSISGRVVVGVELD